MSVALTPDDSVVMPGTMSPAMEEVWRNAFWTHCRRRKNAGPNERGQRILAESAEQVAYKAVQAFVLKHGGYPP